MPVTATANTYATWDTGGSTYTTLEAAPTYGVLQGATLAITHTLTSSGAMASSRIRRLTLSGGFTPSGTLPKQATHKFLGTLTSAGALVRRIGKTFSGATTPGGALVKRASHKFQGTLGSSGSVLLGKIFTRAYAGTLGSSGTVTRVRQLQRTLQGATTPTGALLRQVGRKFLGSLGASGSLAFKSTRLRTYAGTLLSSGTLVLPRQRMALLSGALAPSGLLASARALGRSYLGVLAVSGVVSFGQSATRTLSGVLASSGLVTFQKAFGRTFDGVLAASGFLSVSSVRSFLVAVEGTLRAYGEVRLRLIRGPWPSLSPPLVQPGAPPLVRSSNLAAPLAVLVQGTTTLPAVVSAPKAMPPYAVPAPKPEWLSCNAEPR